MKLEQYEQEQRWLEIPTPIRILCRDNVAIDRIARLYVMGDIVTLEEALCQMIIHLNTNWSKMKTDYIQMISMQTMPMFITK